MKINSLTASFGKLEGDTLELHDGLNVIAAPNESGKSTWCAFIRAMLYGIDTSERERAGYKPDKTKYLPWSGAPMQGSMNISVQGRDITLTRSSSGRAGPMKEFSAVYTGTSTPVEGLNAQNAGEKLLGISKDVFNRSVFVGQGAIPVGGSAELERRIASIVSTGEEGGSYSEADSRLRAWQRKRRHNRIGLLPDTEARLARLDERICSAAETAQLVNSAEAELSAEKEKRTRLEAELTEAKLRARRDALDRLNIALAQLENELAEKKSAREQAEADAKNAETELYNRTAERLKAELDKLEKACAAKKEECRALEQAAQDMRRIQRRDALDKLNLSRAELRACQTEKDAAADELIRAREELAGSPYSGERESVVKKLRADADTVDALSARAEGLRAVSPLPSAIVLALFIAAAVLFALKGGVVFAVCAVCFLAAGIFLIIKYSKAKKAISSAGERIKAILSEHRAETSDGIREAAEVFAALCEAVDGAEKRDSLARAAYEQKKVHQTLLEESALNELDFSQGSTEGARLSRELNAAKEELHALGESAAAAKARLEAFETSGAVPAAEREAYEARLERLRADEREAAGKLSMLKGRAAAIDLDSPVTAEPDAASSSPEVTELSRALIACRERVQELTARAAGLRGRAATFGDPMVLSTEREFLCERKERLEGEYNAIGLALNALRSADAEIQSRFSPALGRKAAEYMSSVTGGRYSEVLVNRDFTVLTRTVGESVSRESAYLSAGTLDLMYLAVRLAVCELALPNGESVPLIIDDALANLDNARSEAMLELLRETAKDRQVILFTCRE